MRIDLIFYGFCIPQINQRFHTWTKCKPMFTLYTTREKEEEEEGDGEKSTHTRSHNDYVVCSMEWIKGKWVLFIERSSIISYSIIFSVRFSDFVILFLALVRKILRTICDCSIAWSKPHMFCCLFALNQEKKTQNAHIQRLRACCLNIYINRKCRYSFACMYVWSIKTPAEKVDANSLLCDHFSPIHVSHNSKMQNVHND